MERKAYWLWIVTGILTGLCALADGRGILMPVLYTAFILVVQVLCTALLTKKSLDGTQMTTAVVVFLIAVIPVLPGSRLAPAASVVPLLYGYSGKLKDEYGEQCFYNRKQVFLTVFLGAVAVIISEGMRMAGHPFIDNVYADIVVVCGIMAQAALLFKEEKDKNTKLAHSVSAARLESSVDALTGLYNRRMMEEIIMGQMHSIQAFSVIMMDIDNFKKVNDTYGHAFGDEVLKGLASVLKGNLRNTSPAFRYGGEEFIIVCPCTSAEDGAAVAERIRMAFNEKEFDFEGETLHFSISLGVSQCTYMEYKSPVDVVKNSDAALYVSKRTGKNRVTVYEPGMEKGEK